MLDEPKGEQLGLRVTKSCKNRLKKAVDMSRRSQTDILEVAVNNYLDFLEKNNYVDINELKISEPSPKYTTEELKQAETDDALRAEILRNSDNPMIRLMFAEMEKRDTKTKNK